DRLPVQRRVAVEAFEPVPGEHCTKLGRNRHSPLGIEAQRVVGHEQVHDAPCDACPSASPGRATKRPRPEHPGLRRSRRPKTTRGIFAPGRQYRMGAYGITWDIMVVNGI